MEPGGTTIFVIVIVVGRVTSTQSVASERAGVFAGFVAIFAGARRHLCRGRRHLCRVRRHCTRYLLVAPHQCIQLSLQQVGAPSHSIR